MLLVINNLLDEVLVTFRIIKAEVGVYQPKPKAEAITLTETLIILDGYHKNQI